MKPSREEVVVAAKEAGFLLHTFAMDDLPSILTPSGDNVLTERLERFAAAIYSMWVAKGAEVEAMRQRVIEIELELAALKAGGEPVAEIEDWSDDHTPIGITPLVPLKTLSIGTKLYTSPAIPDCATCENRGEIDGLSQESHCEHCIYGQKWKTSHYVAAAPKHREKDE